ncbi:MAG: acetyl-CoA carboxylase carboxyltransferase subunit alpha [Candidatus Omnitrophica bacterium]|nr:acetyl-CoA carboxylase carboxyltransferase subunit alpha [Candidatus Omnitrophota bacterium]
MERKYLDFEKPLEAIDKKIEAYAEVKKGGQSNGENGTVGLKQQLSEKTKEIFSNLTDWQIVQLSRHPNRPHMLDYVENIFDDFVELHGDRCSEDDHAVVAGIGKFRGIPVAIAGQQKGRDTKENLFRKFGMAHPPGYRKAMRIMHLAEKLHMPVISFIDTPGANPDIQAEENGQALVIAENLFKMSLLKTPVLCIIIGEGGSGGALGIGVGDRILMQEYSIYSVISPEGCASILWKSQSAAAEAAKALRLTAKALLDMGIIDAIVPEPQGGVHRDWKKAFELTAETVDKHLRELKTIKTDELVELRYQKYRKTGVWLEKEAEENE